MKKQYIIPATDVIEIRVMQMLTTSGMEIITDQGEIENPGDILSREDDFEEDDFDMGEEDF